MAMSLRITVPSVLSITTYASCSLWHALIGVGPQAKPGEVTLAHRGVLFLDELPEFGRKTFESLQLPLEDRKVTINRVNQTNRYPADFMLVAAMNPCPCGHAGGSRCE